MARKKASPIRYRNCRVCGAVTPTGKACRECGMDTHKRGKTEITKRVSTIGVIQTDSSSHIIRASTPLEIFDSGIATVTQSRNATYAHPRVNFNRAQRLKEVVRECKDPLVREALENICGKIARLIETPHHTDSFLDIAGYARTGVMTYSE